jgi:hypothetical protein
MRLKPPVFLTKLYIVAGTLNLLIPEFQKTVSPDSGFFRPKRPESALADKEIYISQG